MGDYTGFRVQGSGLGAIVQAPSRGLIQGSIIGVTQGIVEIGTIAQMFVDGSFSGMKNWRLVWSPSP